MSRKGTPQDNMTMDQQKASSVILRKNCKNKQRKNKEEYKNLIEEYIQLYNFWQEIL
ncbi:hypothetical protein [Thermosipho globiformans]|uniref:hypothetical protein n=1 Tax=Thermosipho globiformans TaxID=380685 RepID=UPI0013DEFDAE|nr:hypothetical protein [Thermosipho globiformans]